MKTLFISDLDGTLLDKSASLSEYTITSINKLIEAGMHFTIATARSQWSVQKIVEPLSINHPAILMNGVFIYDLRTSQAIKSFSLGDQTIRELLPLLDEFDLSGFLYMTDGSRIVVYYKNVITPHALAFMQERIRQFGKIYIHTDCYAKQDFGCMKTVYYTVSDRMEVLLPFYEKVKNIKGLRAEFYRDVYNENLWFLEVLAQDASKANAAEYIKKEYGFDRIVAFGDNLNDLPLFAASDYCVAVGNAHEDVKKRSDEVIKRNTENGVAKWLKENYKKLNYNVL